jgi:copper chaperone
MTRYTLHIDGMSCGHCLKAVNQALTAVTGTTVESVRIGRAEVQADDAVGEDTLVSAVEDAGYNVALVETSR